MMSQDQGFRNIGFIGLGLIGGSIARTLRRTSPDLHLIAYNRSRSVTDTAIAEGVIDEAVDASLAGMETCDLIFLCVPVVTALPFMDRLKEIIGPDTLLTDVGSVKNEIHDYAERIGLGGAFIGGHPMAGSEKTGYMSSTDHLLDNAWYILTPGSEVSVDRISAMHALVASMGALPLIMTSDEHDQVTAAISHLPHVISASLVNLVHDLDGPEKYMRTVAAGGFRDITRISSSSPQMWQEICMSNSRNICRVLDAYMSRLIDYRLAIRSEDADELLRIFTACKDYRDSFNADIGSSLFREYRLYMDLVDEAGSIATIATQLAVNNISIKNIGIVHNREYEQGVLRIVFYDQSSLDAAVRVLTARNYHLYLNS